MNIVFSDQPIPKQITKSIFLAGPSPRENGVYDWKKDAVKILKNLNFDGTIFIPVPKLKFEGLDENSDWSYDHQITWECECRALSDINLFWVARDIQGKMPGFTTNIEFGEDLNNNKIFYGRPEQAEKCKYLDFRFIEQKQQIFTDLQTLLINSINILGDGAERRGGEVYVPLFIWKSDEFQIWYNDLKQAGHKLINAKVLNSNFSHGHLFSFIMKVSILTSERRIKSDEFIISRKNTSTVFAYYQDNEDIKILCVEEFRSNVSNTEGFVLGLPSGSAFNISNTLEVAQQELLEETSLNINKDRFFPIATKQVSVTSNILKSSLFGVQLTSNELQQIINNQDKELGNHHEGEYIKIKLLSLKDIFSKSFDYATLGMIYCSIAYLKL